MSQGQRANDKLREALLHFVKKYDKGGGLEEAAKDLGLSRPTLLNVLADRKVRSGTLSQLREELGKKGYSV